MKKITVLIFGVICIGLLQLSFVQKPEEPITKAQLGKRLFFEPILSKDSSVSCASCHKPDYGFADTTAFSVGIQGKKTKRNTPSVLNMKNRPYYFWDGRAATLEQQALMPIANPDEMGLPITTAIQRLNSHPLYKKLFVQVFGTKATAKSLGAAFAAFEKTLETGQSRFDLSFDNQDSLTDQEERGRQLFVGEKAKCFDCHSGNDFTDDDFKNIGLYDGDALNDKGRYTITKNKADIGRFKTPSLRNVAITAPYMHNGQFATLEQVIEFYNNTSAHVLNSINIDKTVEVPIGFTKQEKADLVAFLRTLTDRRYLPKKLGHQ